MSKHNLPTYAIVELLIRLMPHNNTIGNYKDHSIYNEGVIVKTSGGVIHFPNGLVMQQFEAPEQVTDNALLKVASTFKPAH